MTQAYAIVGPDGRTEAVRFDREDAIAVANTLNWTSGEVVLYTITPVTIVPDADKVQWAARVLLETLGDFDRNRSHPAFEAACVGQSNSTKPAPFNQIGDGLVAALRALAGGDTQ